MADLLSIKANTRVVSIIHPGTDKKIGLEVEVVGMFDPRVKKVQNRLKNQALRKRQADIDADFIDDAADETLITCIVGWKWVKGEDGEMGSFGGEQLEYSAENALKMIKAWHPLRDQINKELENEAAFFQT